MSPASSFKNEALIKAWLRQLARAHHNILWRNNLAAPPVSFALTRGEGLWGRWSPEKRLIFLSGELIENHPWEAVLGILGHETAHQLVTDLLGSPGEKPHGPAFQGMARRIALDPFYAAASVDLAESCPRPWPGGGGDHFESGAARVLERVRKLLALGASPIAAEAENAMKAAARLMTRHNLDILDAEKAQNHKGDYGYRLIRLKARRVNSRLALIAHILSRHFFVESIFVPGYNPREDVEEKNLELLGRPENTRLAEHVFHFLMERTESLWREERRRRAGGGQVARNSFISALLEAFCAKLDEAAAAAPNHMPESGFSAPVLFRDFGLGEYIKSRHPKVTRTAGRRRFCDPESDRAGRAAGRALCLSRPVENHGGGGPPRLIEY